MQKWLCNLVLSVTCLFGWAEKGLAQSEAYQFARYSTEEGLSHNLVNCFFKDRQGFVWIGTADGLNRFDGYSFKIFKHDPADSTTIADHNISDLFEDPEGYLWINTRKGFNIYDPSTGRINRQANRAARRLGLPDANFSRIIKAKSGDYWISHNTLGLLKYLPSKKLLLTIRYKPTPLDEAGKPGRVVISDFNEDSLGNLWVVIHYP